MSRVNHDLIGRVFGRLTVLEKTEKRTVNHGSILWKCLCVCGKEVERPTSSLVAGLTRSCGCLQKEVAKINGKINGKNLKLSDEIRTRNFVFSQYKGGAKNRNIDYLLSKEDVGNFISQKCTYCGRSREEVGCLYMGIDRVDNSKGYVLENCVPCCVDCNKAKGTKTTKEFLDWITLVCKTINEQKDVI